MVRASLTLLSGTKDMRLSANVEGVAGEGDQCRGQGISPLMHIFVCGCDWLLYGTSAGLEGELTLVCLLQFLSLFRPLNNHFSA